MPEHGRGSNCQYHGQNKPYENASTAAFGSQGLEKANIFQAGYQYLLEIILVVLILAPRVPICTEAGLGAVQISVQRYIPMVCMYVRHTTGAYFLILHSENNFIPNSPENNPSTYRANLISCFTS